MADFINEKADANSQVVIDVYDTSTKINDKNLAQTRRAFAFNVYSVVTIQLLIILLIRYISVSQGFNDIGVASIQVTLTGSVLAMAGLMSKLNSPNVNTVLASIVLGGFAYINGALSLVVTKGIVSAQTLVLALSAVDLLLLLSTANWSLFNSKAKAGSLFALGFTIITGVLHFILPFTSLFQLVIAGAVALTFAAFTRLVVHFNMPKQLVPEGELSTEFYTAVVYVNTFYLNPYLFYVLVTMY